MPPSDPGTSPSGLPPLQAQPSLTPTRKTSAVMIGGGASTALSVVLGWALGRMGLEVPAEVQVAMVSLFLAGAAYLTRERQQSGQ